MIRSKEVDPGFKERLNNLSKKLYPLATELKQNFTVQLNAQKRKQLLVILEETESVLREFSS